MDYLMKNMHFIFIHIPIAMLIFSFVFDILAVALKKKDWHTAAILCLVVGTLGTIASVWTGPDIPNPAIQKHALYGKITMVLFILLTALRLWFHWRKKAETGSRPAYLAAAFIGVLLVSYTGHLGGQMVHKEKGPMQRPNGQPAMQGGPATNGTAPASSPANSAPASGKPAP
ncbi:DUF2231 domain-containing protein [Paenibacillus sp. 32352]|uniref:DUF2231 domain-containing protein n=1 Tax=Paenibacillus sp. 32352 TaxID=1969111 RepID=UPI0009AE3814|nr:DUF2231 domain-containing protein [Paenibacillus sp. 32352]